MSTRDQARLPIYLAGRPAFDSVDALYQSRGGRYSPECDLGVWWHGEHVWPHYRLSWIENTGGLYIADQHSARVILLATIRPGTFGEPERTRYLELDRDDTRPLHGWHEHCGPAGGLAWVIDRVRRWRA